MLGMDCPGNLNRPGLSATLKPRCVQLLLLYRRQQVVVTMPATGWRARHAPAHAPRAQSAHCHLDKAQITDWKTYRRPKRMQLALLRRTVSHCGVMSDAEDRMDLRTALRAPGRMLRKQLGFIDLSHDQNPVTAFLRGTLIRE